MNRRATIALLCAVLGGALGCEAALPSPPAAPVAPAAEPPTGPVPGVEGLERNEAPAAPAAGAAAVDWSGEWHTTFGLLHIVQQGGSVSGEYVYENQGVQVQGHLAGSMNGRQLDFEWDEPPGGGGQGSGTFVMSDDGRSFAGTWGKGKSPTDGGAWTGTR